jgi:hypothetical protein
MAKFGPCNCLLQKVCFSCTSHAKQVIPHCCCWQWLLELVSKHGEIWPLICNCLLQKSCYSPSLVTSGICISFSLLQPKSQQPCQLKRLQSKHQQPGWCCCCWQVQFEPCSKIFSRTWETGTKLYFINNQSHGMKGSVIGDIKKCSAYALLRINVIYKTLSYQRACWAAWAWHQWEKTQPPNRGIDSFILVIKRYKNKSFI